MTVCLARRDVIINIEKLIRYLANNGCIAENGRVEGELHGAKPRGGTDHGIEVVFHNEHNHGEAF